MIVGMHNMLPPNAVELMYFILDSINIDVKYIIDMTLGNGNDAYKLLEKYTDSFLYGFDIQMEAINNSYERLSKLSFDNRFRLINDDHQNLLAHIDDRIDLAIYNLGYLPGGDKSIKTSAKSTVISLDKLLNNLLNKSGMVFITSYTGHPGGKEEYDELINYVSKLNQKKYHIISFDFPNQSNNPPKLIVIERLK